MDSKVNLFDLVLLLCTPLLLYVINKSWTFVTPASWVDPFLYTSYFVDLRENLASYGFPYYASRLPWILFGHAAFSVMSYLAADLFLRFFLVYGAGFSVYGITWGLWRKRTAATIAALITVTNTAFLWSASWNYVDGAGIVAILCALLCLTHAAGNSTSVGKCLSFLGGVFAMVALSTNLILVIPALLLGTWLISFSWLRGQRPVQIGYSIVSMALGSICTFLFFAGINLELGGGFNYLQPQIKASVTITPETYGAPPPLSEGGWLVFLVLGAIASVGLLLRGAYSYVQGGRHLDMPLSRGCIAGAHMLTMLSVWVFFDLSLGWRLLNWAYYANYVLPFVFVVIGGFIALSEDSWFPTGIAKGPRSLNVSVAATALVFLLLPFTWEKLRPLPACPNECLAATGTQAALLVTGALILIAIWYRHVVIVITMLAVFALLNVGVADGRAMQFDRATRERAYDRARMRADAEAEVRKYDHGNDTWFWYDYTEPYGPIYAEVTALNMWTLRLVGYEFPKHGNLADNQRLVISSVQPVEPILRNANFSLMAANLHIELERSVTIKRGRDMFNMYFTRVKEGTVLDVIAEKLPLTFLPTPAQLEQLPQGVALDFRPLSGPYGAVLPIPPENLLTAGKRGGAIDVRYNVTAGGLELVVWSKDGSTQVAKSVVTTGDTGRVLIYVSDFSNVSALVFHANNQTAHIEVYGVGLLTSR